MRTLISGSAESAELTARERTVVLRLLDDRVQTAPQAPERGQRQALEIHDHRRGLTISRAAISDGPPGSDDRPSPSTPESARATHSQR